MLLHNYIWFVIIKTRANGLWANSKYTNPQAHFEVTTSNHLKYNEEQLVIKTLEYKQNSHYKNSYRIDIEEIDSSLYEKTRDLK